VYEYLNAVLSYLPTKRWSTLTGKSITMGDVLVAFQSFQTNSETVSTKSCNTFLTSHFLCNIRDSIRVSPYAM
jgi:hypothetical protein